jgi:hypothetical protein
MAPIRIPKSCMWPSRSCRHIHKLLLLAPTATPGSYSQLPYFYSQYSSAPTPIPTPSGPTPTLLQLLLSLVVRNYSQLLLSSYSHSSYSHPYFYSYSLLLTTTPTSTPTPTPTFYLLPFNAQSKPVLYLRRRSISNNAKLVEFLKNELKCSTEVAIFSSNQLPTCAAMFSVSYPE